MHSSYMLSCSIRECFFMCKHYSKIVTFYPSEVNPKWTETIHSRCSADKHVQKKTHFFSLSFFIKTNAFIGEQENPKEIYVKCHFLFNAILCIIFTMLNFMPKNNYHCIMLCIVYLYLKQ